MKNILKEELEQIKYLFGYKKGVVISEQAAEKKDYTVQDIQNKLVELGYKDILSRGGKIKNPVDGKFGPATLSAITTAIRTSNIQAPAAAQTDTKTAETPAANTTTNTSTTDATATTTTASTTGTETNTGAQVQTTTQQPTTKPTKQPDTSVANSEWCKKNTILPDEKCYTVVGMEYNDAERKIRNDAKNDDNHTFKRLPEYWDNMSKTLIRVYGNKSLKAKEVENRKKLLQQPDVTPKQTYSTTDSKQGLGDNV